MSFLTWCINSLSLFVMVKIGLKCCYVNALWNVIVESNNVISLMFNSENCMILTLGWVSLLYLTPIKSYAPKFIKFAVGKLFLTRSSWWPAIYKEFIGHLECGKWSLKRCIRNSCLWELCIEFVIMNRSRMIVFVTGCIYNSLCSKVQAGPKPRSKSEWAW